MDQERESYADPEPPPLSREERWARVAVVLILLGIASLVGLIWLTWLIPRWA